MTELNSSLCQLNWLVAKGGIAEPVKPSQVPALSKAASSSSSTPSPRVRDDDKPPLSYSQLIRMAIENSPGQRCTLNGIYTYISERYAFYKENRNSSWRNSIRHNLSLNKQFIRLEKKEGEKGSFWVCSTSPEKRPRSIEGSPPRINPAVERLYTKNRQKASEVSPYSPSQNLPYHPLSQQNNGIDHQMYHQDPNDISLYNNQPPNNYYQHSHLNGIEQRELEPMETMDDLSELSLFASHDLSASFKKVYDQVFHNRECDRIQQEAQIDWLKIGLETAGLDYRNDDELHNMDTQRFSEYLTNGFPDYPAGTSEASTPRACNSRVMSGEVNDTNGSLERNHSMAADEESEDEFDWSSIA